MQELRRKQIEEILDEDRNINKEVFRRQQKQVKVFSEEVKPLDQANVDSVFKTEKDVDVFLGRLDDMDGIMRDFFADIHDYGNWMTPNQKFVLEYNVMVQNARIPTLTSRTRSAISNRIQYAAEPLAGLKYLTRQACIEGIKYIKYQNKKAIVYLSNIILLYGLTKLMEQRLSVNDFTPITPTDSNYMLENVLMDFSSEDVEIIKKSYTYFSDTGLELYDKRNLEKAIRIKEHELGRKLTNREKLIFTRTFYGNVLPTYYYLDSGIRAPTEEEEEEVDDEGDEAIARSMSEGQNLTAQQLINQWRSQQQQGSEEGEFPPSVSESTVQTSPPPGSPSISTYQTSESTGTSGQGRKRIIRKKQKKQMEKEPLLYDDTQNEMFNVE
jgi:hypothetical protein